MLKKLTSLALVLFLQAGFGSDSVLGYDYAENKIWIREGGNDYEVQFDVASGEMRGYPNGVQRPTPHKTTKGATQRYYDHVHITYTLPKTGTVVGDPETQKEVTETKIHAYWDNTYGSGYLCEGTEDVAKNCHGYAFDIATWIEDCTYIDEDDYQSASGWADAKVLRGEGNTHSIKVNAFDTETMPDTVKTKEKNGPSRIYKADWQWSNPPGSGTKKKPK